MIFCDKRYLGLLSWHSNYQGPFSQTRFRKTISPPNSHFRYKRYHYPIIPCCVLHPAILFSDCLLLFTLLRGLPYLGRSRGEIHFCQTGMCTSVSDISQRDNMSGIHMAEGESGDKYTSSCYPGDTNQARNTCVF